MDPFIRTYADDPYHHLWTQRNQDEPPETAVTSPLLALGRSSDVDPLLPDQVADARAILRARRRLVSDDSTDLRAEVLDGQRRVVERYLDRRRGYFGERQSRPLPVLEELVRERRDTFLVIKFMDEAPHLAATLRSLLHQRGFDLRRVVIVAVDNNSTDGSDRIVQQVIESNRTAARVVYLNQAIPGAGNAARFGVDTCIATVYEMCRSDGRWERLQTATIAVSDGDTVYHPDTLQHISRILSSDPLVDGVMPFLVYKWTAALRLFRDYRPADPQRLARRAAGDAGIPVATDLSGIHAHRTFPRWGRHRQGDGMRLVSEDGVTVSVPLRHTDEDQRSFGVLRDPDGHRAYVLADRTLALETAPVSGFDAALVFLENGGVRRDEKWRWHALVGHDLFLHWAFVGMGLPERMVFPDTSDALKTFRVWSFAIGGQHQLRRPGLRIATGSDYQSGRVLQAVGATVRLASARVFAETETDRLIKMVRNFVQRQAVFYGETRSEALERATGLYVHMTRIQPQLEQELRGYPDELFEHIVFPERVIFPLRWMLQNAVRFHAHGGQARQIVRERVLEVVFSAATAAEIDRELLGTATLRALSAASYSDRQSLAEQLAELLITRYYPELMTFYAETLRGFFVHERIPRDRYEWLLEGLPQSRNAIVERPPSTDVTAVWADGFEIDVDRGQVMGMADHPASLTHSSRKES